MAFITTPLLPTRARPPITSLSPRRRYSPCFRQTPRAAAKAIEVSADELEVKLQANERPMVVDAFAPWCGPCKYLLPQLDIVAEKYGERIDVVKFDTEEYPDLASALMIRGLPTLFFISDGKLRYRMEGAVNAEQLDQLVDYIFFDGPPPKQADLTPSNVPQTQEN